MLVPALWLRSREPFDFHNDPPLLAVILKGFAQLDCKDPHDKIYALLALVRDGADIPVDYNSNPEDIFWSTFNALQAEENIQEEAILDPSGIARIAMDMGVFEKTDRVTFKLRTEANEQ